MRKYIRNEIEEILKTLLEAHKSIKELLRAGVTDNLVTLLSECQGAAISIGEQIEESEGEGTKPVSLLEEYCEALYAIQTEQETNIGHINSLINECIESMYSLPETREVIFLPYKASMWDSLESIWKEKNADPCCKALVIPIPYFDKNPDGSLAAMHYEGEEYPQDVPVVNYLEYDFEAHHPDEIYIHNPYDEFNLVTTVHPSFYCNRLKQWTDKLIYIPYFVLSEAYPENAYYLESIEHFVIVPGVIWADEVIVQSEAMAKAYTNILTKWAKEGGNEAMADPKRWERIIKGTGSPKITKIRNMKSEDISLPEEWVRLITRPDGSRRKIMLYNTGIAAFLAQRDKMLDKIERVLESFYERREEIILWWRPHPLIRATIESISPQLLERYSIIVDQYIKEGWGIYDDTPDMDRALVASDAYYGDSSSLVSLYQELKKPVMIQNVDV